MSTLTVLMLAPGQSIHSVRPLNCLLAAGCRVVFVDEVDPQPASRERFTFVPYPNRGRPYRKVLGWRLGGRVERALVTWQLKRLYRRVAPDVVHVHWVDSRAAECAAAALHPLVLTVWGSDVNLALEPCVNPVHRQIVSDALAGADFVLVDSDDMPPKVARLAGRAVPTVVLPLGVDTRHFRPVSPLASQEWRQKMDVGPDAVLFMSVRAMGPYYNHERILEAFAAAHRRIRRPAYLAFKVYNTKDYPASDRIQANLRQQAQALGVAPYVRWLEAVPFAELPALFGAADAVLNYPSMDAFPVTFMEAASCQCPVISAALPAYRGTFAETFFRIVPPEDPAAFADAIQQHADGDLVAARAALAPARELMIREYDESVTTQRLIAHYRELIARRDPP